MKVSVKVIVERVLVGVLLTTLSLATFAKDIVIEEKDLSYFMDDKDVTGKTIDATVNDNLKVVNKDTVTHNVTITLENDTKTKLNDSEQKPTDQGGQEIVVNLKTVGKVNLQCTIHPNMNMTFNVK